MQTSYSQPLDHAWRRMKTLLFHPFDLGRWFVLGFTAWLAQLSGGYSGGGSGGGSGKFQFFEQWDEAFFQDSYNGAWESVQGFFEYPWAFMLAGMILMGILLIWLVVLWLSSRGHFMFLDNLVHSRTEVKTPWSAFRSQGDSLFLWQVVYSLIVFLLMGSLLAVGILMFFPVLALEPPLAATLPLVILAGTVGFILVVALVYIEFFLTHFVVPIMYRHGISTTEAWKRFLSLFREHPGSFVLFGLLYFGVMLVGWILFFVGGLVTCCIGLILMAIPYIGTVITLPLHTFARFLSVEFLGQFGNDFRLLQPLPNELPVEPDHPYGSDKIQGDGTVVGPQDVGQDPGGNQSGPENL
ncbi:MAG: hypothetical protein KAH56_03005 [Candidatus Krumholzibacteria bacterium]|nr:hypothetical protein [Candidatus Krumholzibacteria bacterium]